VPRDLDWLDDDRIEFVRRSITDEASIKAALDGIEYIVHLASETGTGQSMYEIARYSNTNSQGTAVLLNSIINNSNSTVKKIVLTSSRSVYGEGAYKCIYCFDECRRISPNPRSAEQLARRQWETVCRKCGKELVPVATREDDPIMPASIYAATKYSQEQMIQITCESVGVKYSILRLQNVYGEGQSLNNPYTGILSIFSNLIRQGKEVPIFEDGKESRDFVHVDDVVAAISACLFNENMSSETINVGSGVATSVHNVAMYLTEALNMQVPIRVTSEYRLGDIRHNFANIDKLLKIMPSGPSVSLKIGLQRFAEWVSQQPVVHSGLEAANNEMKARKLMRRV
jgi:dTDP-L-rhamnose 4-epimerase